MPRDFRFLLISRFFFNFSISMQAILLGWRMYELSHDPLYLGLIGLAEAIPALGLALFAGLIVDHSSPLWTFRGVLFVSLISGLVLYLSQSPLLHLSTHDQIWSLYLAAFITGAARSFSQPSIFAMIPRLVSQGTFSRTNAWLATSMQMARISGPAIGGLIFAGFGLQASSFIVCSGLAFSLIPVMLMKPLPKDVKPSPHRESITEKLLSGAKYVFRHPILFPAMTLDMVSVLFGGVTALFPIYAADILKIGAQGLGLLRAAPAIGAAIMSFWLTNYEITKSAGKYLLWSVAGFGFSTLVFTVSHSLPLSVIALALSGAFDSVSMVIRGTAVQMLSPDNMRGRISAVNSIFIGSSNELGELESGVAAKLLGVIPSAMFGALVCLLTVGVVSVTAPTLRKMNLDKP